MPVKAVICLSISLIALGFLGYTLLNLKKLGLPLLHGRVVVEAIVFILFLILFLIQKIR